MKAITASNLTKRYKSVTALKSLNFEIVQGEMFGFIGPDGAGKTSLFRVMTSLLVPDEGSVSVLGNDAVKDYKEIRRISGYMPGRFSLYPDLTVEENLQFFASIFKSNIEENYHLIKDIYSHIEPFKKRRAGKLSGGMKQKLALSCALIHKPEILFLDEPTTGVDPVSRQEFWEMLGRLKDEGLTIVVSTPYMDEASRCDRIAMMHNGNILATNTPKAISQMLTLPLFSASGKNNYQLLKWLRNQSEISDVFPFGQEIHFSSEIGSGELKSKLIGFDNEAQVQAIQPTVEDVFLHLSQNLSETKPEIL